MKQKLKLIKKYLQKDSLRKLTRQAYGLASMPDVTGRQWCCTRFLVLWVRVFHLYLV